eukprot:11189214-Lingulodinium_polyedra.AAC.1
MWGWGSRVGAACRGALRGLGGGSPPTRGRVARRRRSHSPRGGGARGLSGGGAPAARRFSGRPRLGNQGWPGGDCTVQACAHKKSVRACARART